jgi:hypothetical protein
MRCGFLQCVLALLHANGGIMRKRPLATLAMVMTLSTIPLGIPRALAGESVCVGTLPSGTYDQVLVPPGATCTLSGSTVRGNVKALDHSFLSASNNHILGNVDGEHTRTIWVFDNLVEGNIRIRGGGTAESGPADVAIARNLLPQGNIHIAGSVGEIVAQGNIVQKGNLQVREILTTTHSHIVGNQVSGQVQVFRDQGPGSKQVQGNTAGRVQCFQNAEPFVGGPNSALITQGQCF